MLVSHSHRFIFTKTIKTAGTSVEGYLENYCKPPADRGEPQDYHPQQVSEYGIVGIRGVPAGVASKTYRWYNHKPAADIKRDLGDETWNNYFKFTTVRNPYDRVASYYYFYNQVLCGRPQQSLDQDRTDFIKFIDDRKSDITYSHGAFMIDGKCCLDGVIKYENILDDMEWVCYGFNIPWNPKQFPRFKTGVRPPEATVQALYTDQSRQLVTDLCGVELDLFEYKFNK